MIEIIAVVPSILCVYLTAIKNQWCWPIGLIGVLGYMWIFYQNGQIANTLLQVVFIGQSLFGWWNWQVGKLKFNLFDKVSKINSISKMIGITGILSGFLYLFLLYMGGSDPILDSMTTSLSLVGITLLAYKRYEAWYFWIIADIFYVIMFGINAEYLLMGNYIIFLGLATMGLIKWKKDVIQNRRK